MKFTIGIVQYSDEKKPREQFICIAETDAEAALLKNRPQLQSSEFRFVRLLGPEYLYGAFAVEVRPNETRN